MTTLRSKCPTGCGRAVAPGKLMCAPCWREVPKELQREVYAAWRALSSGSTVGDPVERYRAARDAAIGSIR